jgi:hypothetical protein
VPRSAGVAAVSLVLYGCASMPVAPEPGRPRGALVAQAGRPGFVIAAPGATADARTGQIATEIARQTGFGFVVAAGFSLEPDPPELERRVLDVARGPLRLYVEIRGNGRAEPVERLEIATAGLPPDAAWRVRTLLELVRDARLRAHPDAPRLAVLVEPIDRPETRARALPAARALHVGLPRSALTGWRALYTDVLAQFLSEVAPLLVAPGSTSSPP